jgi:hypothetical protein
MKNKNLFGKKMTIVGTVEEHLVMESKNKEWVKLTFPNGSSIVIDVKYCKEVDEGSKSDPSKDC